MLSVYEYMFKFTYSMLMNGRLSDVELKTDMALFGQNFIEDIKLSPDEYQLVTNKLTHLLSQLNEIESSIVRYLRNDDLNRIPKTTLGLLYVAVYELNAVKREGDRKQVETIVTFVNLANKYCPNEAGGFVNSILDQLFKENR